jgi:lipopolysaccharide export system permease protein
MLAYGRLYADSEMPVLNASGLGIKRLIGITSVLTLIITAIVLLLVLWINPLIAAEKGKSLMQNNMLDTLRPGRFQVINNGQRVIYVEKISRDRKMANNLFIAEEQKKSVADASNPWVIVSADAGYQAKGPDQRDDFIISTNGYRYEGTPGLNAFKIIQFKKYAVRIPRTITNNHEEEAVPTATLWHDYHTPAANAELQWRFAFPISVLVLALLAIPLSQVRPRQGRYSHILPAILIYIVYVNLLFIARNWIDQRLPLGVLGIWWVHGLLLTLALILLLAQRFFQLRPFPFFKAGR